MATTPNQDEIETQLLPVVVRREMEVEVIADGDGEMERGMHSPVSSGELFGGGGEEEDMRAAARAALAAALGAGGEGGGGTLDAAEGLNAGLDVGRANTGKAEAGGTAAVLLGHGRRGRPSESPEKKQKVQNQGMFPPIFGGGVTSEGAPAFCERSGGPPSVPRYDISMEVAPPWAIAMQHGISKLDAGQSEIALAFQETRQDLRSVVDKVAHLESRQDQSLHRTRDIEVRLQEMEKELKELRSRSPSVAPTTPRGATTPGGRSSTHDTWQLVIGGWVDARRIDIEDEVRAWFSSVKCAPLLQDIHGPQVRGNTCRVSIMYTEDTDRANRQVQSKLLQCLQAAGWKSRIDGQSSRPLWVKRNRSPEERATVRALVSLKALVAQHASPSTFEFDWRGKFWLQGQQVLFHVSVTPPRDRGLLLLDARGVVGGWAFASQAIED